MKIVFATNGTAFLFLLLSFVQQSDIALHEAYLLESQDRHGGIQWAKPNVPVR